MKITKRADISALTTFRLPAHCRCLVEYESVADLRRMREEGLLTDFFHIGGGSNLLFVDEDFDKTVVRSLLTVIEEVGEDSTSVVLRVGGGTKLGDLCCYAANRGLWGVENLDGIPGTVGGAAVQNAGAYGSELADVVESIEVFSPADGCELLIDKAKCRFAYRDSVFKRENNNLIILYVDVRLKKPAHGAPNLRYPALAKALEGIGELTPAAIGATVRSVRNAKLPPVEEVGSAGSFFKNPVVDKSTYASMLERYPDAPGHATADGNVKLSAAWLIDRAGGKALSCGGASVWPTQPLVLVNRDFTATGSDVVGLEEKIRAAVGDKFGIHLHPEVIHLTNHR